MALGLAPKMPLGVRMCWHFEPNFMRTHELKVAEEIFKLWMSVGVSLCV